MHSHAVKFEPSCACTQTATMLLVHAATISLSTATPCYPQLRVMLTPCYSCRLDTASSNPEPQLFRQTKLKGGYVPAPEFVTKQEFATSKDGTRVPMFITHKKGTPLDGTAPTLLYGYGGMRGIAVHQPSPVPSWMEPLADQICSHQL